MYRIWKERTGVSFFISCTSLFWFCAFALLNIKSTCKWLVSFCCRKCWSQHKSPFHPVAMACHNISELTSSRITWACGGSRGFLRQMFSCAAAAWLCCMTDSSCSGPRIEFRCLSGASLKHCWTVPQFICSQFCTNLVQNASPSSSSRTSAHEANILQIRTQGRFSPKPCKSPCVDFSFLGDLSNCCKYFCMCLPQVLPFPKEYKMYIWYVHKQK